MEMLPALRTMVAATMMLLMAAASASAQMVGPSSYIGAGVGISYFPSYITEDSYTRQWGPALQLYFHGESGRRLELGYAYVPQSSTTSSAAPRMHAARLMVAATTPFVPGSNVRLTGSFGVVGIRINAQQIDCGTFPLCAEWAARDDQRIGLAFAGGLESNVRNRFDVFADLRTYRQFGEPSSPGNGPRWLQEIGAGMRIRLDERR